MVAQTNSSTTTDSEHSFSDGANSEKRDLTMIAGAFYIPKERESKPQGDDAYFICLDKQTIGVADGVGCWTSRGIDAGEYARKLMSNSVNAIQDVPKDQVDPSRVLNEAYSNTKVEGSSTACIMTLKEGNRLHVVNVGDSGFILIRKGEDIYQSPVQHHSFNHPYQLRNGSRNPSIAQVFQVAVEPGDVIIAGSDGLFDNLFPNQIEEIAKIGIEQYWDPEHVAWTVAGHAYYNSMDSAAHTPFTQAAIKAGQIYQGGKPDDITVIVSYIVEA